MDLDVPHGTFKHKCKLPLASHNYLNQHPSISTFKRKKSIQTKLICRLTLFEDSQAAVSPWA